MRNLAPLLLVVLCGCGSSTRKCKSHTLFLNLAFDAGSAGADTLDVTLTLDGNTEHPSPVTRSGSGNSVEIDFDSYPEGKTLDVSINALAGGSVIGAGMKSITLVAGCTTGTLNITSGDGEDLSMTSSDLSMSREDMSSQGDMPAAEIDMTPSNSDMANCNILYVAPGGDNLQDGCQPSRPLASIKTAIAMATAAQEVHVCAGTYSETALSIAGVVKGGYSCSTWDRTGTFGYPNFDSTNESIIQNANYALSTATVTIASPSPSPVPIVFDGFTIQGSAVGSNGSTALFVTGDATITNNTILGGGTSSTTVGSIGLEADGNDEIFNNSIGGGSGSVSTAAFGSIGVDLNPGSKTVRLHDNLIDGGTGSATFDSFGSDASVGLRVQSGTYTGANAIQSNTINGGGGTGNTSGGDGFAAVAVKLEGSCVVDLLQNSIDGGVGKGSKEGIVGVISGTSGHVNVRGNRIYGGKAGSPAPSFYNSWGMQIFQGSDLEIANNFIHGGDANGGGTYASGILSYSSGVVIHHNTILGGSTGGTSSSIFLVSTSLSLVAENNLLGGQGGTSAGLFLASGCPSTGMIKAFNDNGVLFGTPMVNNGTAAPCTVSTFASASAMETEITTRCTSGTTGACMSFGGATAGGNVTLASGSCPDTQCSSIAACSTADGCFGAVFNGWDITSHGKSDLFGTGWKLIATDPCKLNNGGKDLTATVLADFYGTTRTAPVSMGAHELDSCVNF